MFADGLLTTAPETSRRHVTLHDRASRPAARGRRRRCASIPRSAADDAAWLTVTAWQGGGLVVDRLARARRGVYRTTEPIPVHGDWKALDPPPARPRGPRPPVYLPEDPAIPGPRGAGERPFTRAFVADHEILQREQKPGVPGWLKTAAPLVVLVLALTFLARSPGASASLGRRTAPEAPSRPRREPRLRPDFDPHEGAAVTERRQCIIGAGYAGNGVAKAFTDAGIPYDQLEKTDHVGGNWAHGVYDSTHIISSRDSTHTPTSQCPATTRTFPLASRSWTT